MVGKVYLVGAGPYDEQLITVKGLNLIKEADVLIYDYLANDRLLKHCKLSCEKIYVGKKAGNHTLSQEGINDLILTKAKENNVVVRLKGGDPYVFGRGGEEGEHLYHNGVEFEVVPGISSSIGGLAYAGIPVTHRGIATSFHVITGHLSQGTNGINFKALSQLDGTLIFLMGIGNIDKITKGLIDGGKSPQTKAAIIYQASYPEQQTIVGDLETIGEMKLEGVAKPGIIVVGEVINKKEVLSFFEEKPFFNKKIIVTRATNQNSTLLEKIQQLGGRGVELPTIKIKPINDTLLTEKIGHLDAYTHMIFTSHNTVNLFFKKLYALNMDARALGHMKISVIGSVTKKMLENYGIKADYIAGCFHSDSLLETVKENITKQDSILLPISSKANHKLEEGLSAYCKVDRISIYDTLAVEHSREEYENALEDADYIFFTSASTVEYFFEPVKAFAIELSKAIKFVSIGPKTSERLRSYGYKQYIEATRHTIDGMLNEVMSK